MENEKAQQILLEQKQGEKLKEYFFLINNGDEWIEKENWINAIYRYRKAVELYPNEYEANYRLALAYSYRCQYANKDCKIGKTLTNKLLKHFPEEPNLFKLKNIFIK